MNLAAGSRLGPYEILSLIGAGGMGEVYRALDTRLGREIALKALPQALRQDAILRARFEQEARTTSALNHPNIVCIHDIGEENDVLYMVSELVDGEPLRKVIHRGALPARRLIDIGQQIAEGLAAAHSAGVLHRDLKPENILVKSDGQVKIIDFGVAKQLALRAAADVALTQTLTTPGMVMGTVGYMSPEQIRAQSIDPRSDIFSFGIVLYEMAAGRSAFPGASGADVMSAILREEPPEIQNADMPAGLGLIIHRCLQKDPARRFQNASDLAFAIRNLSAGAPVPAFGFARPTGRRIWLAWAALAVCLAAGASYWMLLHQRTELARPPAATAPVTTPSTATQSRAALPSAPIAPQNASRPEAAQRVARESAAPKPSVARHEIQPAPAETKTSGKPAPAAVSVAAPVSPPETDPHAGEMLSRGQQLNRAGQYTEAVDAFNQAILSKPDYAAAYVGRGNAYFFLQQFDRALEDYDQAIKIQPGYALAHDLRGRVLLRQKQFNGALDEYNQAIRLKPDLALSYVDRGHLYNQQGEYQKAIQDFDQAIRLNTDLPNAYSGRALAKARLGDKAGAAADRQQAAQIRK